MKSGARQAGMNIRSDELHKRYPAFDVTDASYSAFGSSVAKHALLLAIGLRYRRLRSSMLAAIERGREPAIDYLNGEVAERGKKHGIDVPVNQAVVDTVHSIARGEIRSSRRTLDSLFDRTRP